MYIIKTNRGYFIGPLLRDGFSNDISESKIYHKEYDAKIVCRNINRVIPKLKAVYNEIKIIIVEKNT